MKLFSLPKWLIQIVHRNDIVVISMGGWVGHEIDEKDSEEYRIYGDDWIYEAVEDYAEEVLNDWDPDCDQPKDLPSKVWYCKKHYRQFPNAETVAKHLWRDEQFWKHDPKWYYTFTTAQSLYDNFIENLYSMCDPYPDPDTLDDARGLDELQEALDQFASLNENIWKWAKTQPRLYLGLDDLQKALDAATTANHHHYTLLPDYDRPILLNSDFWKEQIKLLFDD